MNSKNAQPIWIQPLITRLADAVHRRALGQGKYARHLHEGTLNAYGCADAANILYTIGKFPREGAERSAMVSALQDLQDPDSGLFTEGTHHVIHTTAHCTAALELFDALPLYPLRELKQYTDVKRLSLLLTGIDWLKCGKGAHPGAGIYSALSIVGDVDASWRREYFRWFDETCDSETGFWIKAPVNPAYTTRLQLGDAFHYYFTYEHAHHPFPYPNALIDSALAAYRNGGMEKEFGRQFHFIEMDWVYCLNRASRQTPHRFSEIREVLAEFARGYVDFLLGVDFESDPRADDLHLLFGVSCCLAELQSALPGLLPSETPLRLTLDRRPFI